MVRVALRVLVVGVAVVVVRSRVALLLHFYANAVFEYRKIGPGFAPQGSLVVHHLK